MIIKNRPIALLLSVIFFVSTGVGQFYFDALFSIKPFMVAALLILIYIAAHLNRKIAMPKFVLFEYMYILFMLGVCLSIIISFYPSQTARYALGSLSLLALYFILRVFFCNFLTFKSIKESIAKAGFVLAVLNFCYYIIGLVTLNFDFIGNNLVNYGVLIDRNYPRFIGLASSDPNFTAVYLSLFFIFFLSTKKNYTIKIVYLLMILLTFSRGAYISIILAMIVTYLFGKQKLSINKFIRTIFSYLSVAAVVIFLTTSLLKINTFDLAFNRFQDASVDGGSGRIELWENAFTTFKKSPLYGIGANSSLTFNKSNFGSAIYTHNTFLDVLIEMGVLGMFLFLFGIFLVLKVGFPLLKSRVSFAFTYYIAILLQSAFLSFMVSELYTLALLLVFIASHYLEKVEKNITNEN